MKIARALTAVLTLLSTACGDSATQPDTEPGTGPIEFRHSTSDPAYVSVADGRLSVRFGARAGRVRRALLVSGSDTLEMHLQLNNGLTDTWRVAADRGLSSYSLLIETTDSTETHGPYTPPVQPFQAVEWVASAVGYQIFPERFWNGDRSNDTLALGSDEYDFQHSAVRGTPPVVTSDWSGPVGGSHCCHQYFGGDLQGIIDRLGDLDARGVTVLYLNPIFSSGSAHGYDTFDYLEVAANFGDSTVLRALLDQAHARGMRVIWDYVPNHVGIGHWAFQDAIERGETSDYWDWFRFRVPADSVQAGNGAHYDGWWGIGSLPELQTVNSEVMDHLLEVARRAHELRGRPGDRRTVRTGRRRGVGGWRGAGEPLRRVLRSHCGDELQPHRVARHTPPAHQDGRG
jgi:hypothetical protein